MVIFNMKRILFIVALILPVILSQHSWASLFDELEYRDELSYEYSWIYNHDLLIERDGLVYVPLADVPFTGKTTGKIQTSYKDGKLHGEYLNYYDNGQLYEVASYVNGKEHGEYLSYYDNGQLWYKTNYLNGKREGETVTYGEIGELLGRENFVDGKRYGERLTYYKGYLNERLKYKSNWVNGKGHGEFFSYRGNGELESKSNYLNDKLHGELINYDENGKVWETNTYVNGVLKSSISICNDSLSQETYLRIYDEMGLDVNLDRYELTQVNSNICHFKLYLSTHRRNYIYKIKEDKLVNLTDGDLLFEYRRDKGITVKVKGQKSYLNDLGGAIWYNSERDLEGKLLALLDIEEGTWISKDQFDDEFQAQLTAQGQDGLVVFQK